jgi:hypothetical protein
VEHPPIASMPMKTADAARARSPRLLQLSTARAVIASALTNYSLQPTPPKSCGISPVRTELIGALLARLTSASDPKSAMRSCPKSAMRSTP